MSKTVGIYPRIGQVDGGTDWVLDLPDVESGSAAGDPVTIPTSTNTQFRALTNMSGAGRFCVRIEGTVYVIPLLTNA
jgi:hypothetical protein